MSGSRKSKNKRLERREFLQKGALAGAAAIVGSSVELTGQSTPPASPAPLASPAPPAPPAQGVTPIMTAAGEAIGPGEVQVLGDNQRSGSDFMVDVLQVARLRVRLRQSRVEFPRPARIDHQLRRQQEPRADHLHARGVGRRHGARVLQGRRQADARGRARHRRPAARVDGALQRLVRSRAGLHGDRQLQRRGGPPAGRVVPRRPGCRAHGARLHEVGRHAVVAHALRGIGGARVQRRGDAADGAGRARPRRHPAGAGRRHRQASRNPEGAGSRRRRRAIPRPSNKPRGCSSPPKVRCSSSIASRARRTG